MKFGAARRALLTAALLAIAAPAFAQAPTEAQKSAIRSSCRSDFMVHCASVKPGGIEAVQCLQKNLSSLSAGCQTAVRAIEPPAAPKAEAAPAAPKTDAAPTPPKSAAVPKTETAPPAAKAATAPVAAPVAKPAAAPKAAAAAQPSSAQAAAIKSACRGDYPKVCASVPPGGAPALECLEKNKTRVSAACASEINAAGGGAAATGPAPAGAAPTAAAPPAPSVIVLRPLRPREELFIARSACGADIRTLCAGTEAGGGRIIQCITRQAASLSPACRQVLAAFAR
jgi:hypothetical protein